MNGGTRLSYYNYTIEVKNLHIYFVVSVILHIDANLFYLFIICLLIYIYIYSASSLLSTKITNFYHFVIFLCR